MTEGTQTVPPEVVVPIRTAFLDGRVADGTWNIAVEVPVQISINGAPFTVLLASPSHLQDLARGVLLSEQLIDDTSRVTTVNVAEYLQECTVDVVIPPEYVRAERVGARSLLGNSGCGLCGIEALSQLQQRPTTAIGPSVDITDDAIRLAAAALPERQPLNARTHSVHAAAWCSLDGAIGLVREDVGRHNALDKVIGALAADERLGEPGFLLLTSRCSYELVYKATVANTQLLVTIGAPTSMALQWAAALQLPLAALIQQRDAPPAVVRFPPSPSTPTTHAG